MAGDASFTPALLSLAEDVPYSTQTSGQRIDVDVEHKATRFNFFSFSLPHARAFHLSWIGFAATFISTFAPAALLPALRDDLNLTTRDISNAGVASVCGSIVARVAMGTFIDRYGSRYGMAAMLLLTAPAIFAMCLINSAAGFILLRLLTGLSLSSFVACQYWCISMYNVRVVGTVTSLAAGLGNAGGGAALLIMPLVVHAIEVSGLEAQPWRASFFFPGCLHLLAGVLVLLTAQDTPDGNCITLHKARALPMVAKGCGAWRAALGTYRTWLLGFMYALSFGTELTVDNILAQYIFDTFDVTMLRAGALASVFGLMNVFTRVSGGLLSDRFSAAYGMRGRLWWLFAVQLLGGAFCIAIGQASHSLVATMALLAFFSLFIQAACGACYAILPFVSKRSTGLVSGMVAAAGTGGSAFTQAIFFGSVSPAMHPADGFTWMGVVIAAGTLALALLYFPPWGGMLRAAKPGVTEELFYVSEFSPDERAQGLHTEALKFAYEVRSQRSQVSNAYALPLGRLVKEEGP